MVKMKRTGIFRKINKIGYVRFVRILICIVCICLIIFLTHFCIESNKVQTHEFDFSWLASDTLLLDSISVSIIYPTIEPKTKYDCLQIRIFCFMRGNMLSYSSPKKYYLRDGNLVNGIIGNMKLISKAQTDEKKPLIKFIYTDLSDIYRQAKVDAYHQHTVIKRENLVTDIFFVQPNEESFSERFYVTNIYYGNYTTNLFSPFNLQKKCIKIRMDSLCKSNLTIDFNAPFNISDFTHEPDSKEFGKLHFNERKTLASIFASKNFSATFDILPYEGLQTTRNMFIGIAIPMLLSCIYYQLKHLKWH